MASLEVKARMPTSAPGSPEARCRAEGPATALRFWCQRQAGFTLLELLVVVSLIALATTGVGLALRDSRQTGLDLDAQRLAAWLNAAHAQARTTGVAVAWEATPDGVWLAGTHHTWSAPATRLVPPTGQLIPEPLLPPSRLQLEQGNHQAQVASDGVRPFQFEPLARP